MQKDPVKPPVPLSTLFSGFSFPFSPSVIPDTPVTGIAIDSRKVEQGNLFIAISGGTVDGHDFIPEAIRRGASAVVCDKEIAGLPVPCIRVPDSRESLTWLAAAFFGFPGRKMTVIGVTGTDGKTTTCNLIYQILQKAGYRTGLISTVNAIIGNEVLDTGFHVTTPDAQDVQSYLAKMAGAGLTHAVLETTSHGWAQHRVDACEFDIGVVTNITHEHLDQHGSFENYRAAKARLFQSLEKTLPKPQGNPRLAILNKDDSSYEYLSNLITGPKTSYGLGPGASIRAEKVLYQPTGIRFDAVGEGFRFPVTSPLIGSFNVSNCLAALAVALKGLNIAPAVIVDGIASMPGIPGRMERISLGQPFAAIVDFAHTPNALKVAIETVRKMTSGRVIVIFGSAGLRDKQKRRMMAEVAAQLADISILTAEDPRSESLDAILEEMASGARSKGGVEGRSFWRIADRGEAIRRAVFMAEPEDVVMACGKGHEQSMCFGATEYPWDDRVAMRAALAEYLHVNGPEMPYLPTQGK